nr:hypothetical protein CFP56_77702 [Quercus suber]
MNRVRCSLWSTPRYYETLRYCSESAHVLVRTNNHLCRVARYSSSKTSLVPSFRQMRIGRACGVRASCTFTSGRVSLLQLHVSSPRPLAKCPGSCATVVQSVDNDLSKNDDLGQQRASRDCTDCPLWVSGSFTVLSTESRTAAVVAVLGTNASIPDNESSRLGDSQGPRESAIVASVEAWAISIMSYQAALPLVHRRLIQNKC